MVKIYMTHKGYGSRGPLYEVSHDGNVIVGSTTVPLFDGARALAAMGLEGSLEVWDHKRPYPRMVSTIEAAAKLTVFEGERRPTIAKWTPRDYDADS